MHINTARPWLHLKGLHWPSRPNFVPLLSLQSVMPPLQGQAADARGLLMCPALPIERLMDFSALLGAPCTMLITGVVADPWVQVSDSDLASLVGFKTVFEGIFHARACLQSFSQLDRDRMWRTLITLTSITTFVSVSVSVSKPA